MSKLASLIKINAVFLAIVLISGTIATILPSAQAVSYNEDGYNPKYQSYKGTSEHKFKDNSVILNKIKCNNINSNNNGVDDSLGLPISDDAIAEAQSEDKGQATTAANDWGLGERNGHKQNNNEFKFVCINNNDNEITPIPSPEPTITCEECFTEHLTPEQLAVLNSVLINFKIPFFPGVPESEILIDITNLPAFCTILTVLQGEEAKSNAIRILLFFVNLDLFPEDKIPPQIIEEIIQCVLEALE